MTCLDDPGSGMTTIHVEPGRIVVLQPRGAKEFAHRCPILNAALIECSSFVNWRRIEMGEEPILALSIHN